MKHVKLFENFKNKQALELDGYANIDWKDNSAIDAAFDKFIEKHYEGYKYHPIPSLTDSEMRIGMLVKPGDSTLNNARCLYWNNNYATVYTAPFPC